MALQLHHRIIVIRFQRQIAALGNCSMRCSTFCIHAVVGIALEEPSFLQESGYTMTDGMYKLPEFLNIWGDNPLETQFSMSIFHIHTVEKEDVKVQIEIKGRTESLNQSDRPGLYRRSGKARGKRRECSKKTFSATDTYLDQMCGIIKNRQQVEVTKAADLARGWVPRKTGTLLGATPGTETGRQGLSKEYLFA